MLTDRVCLSVRQTDRQTRANAFTSSFVDGNNKCKITMPACVDLFYFKALFTYGAIITSLGRPYERLNILVKKIDQDIYYSCSDIFKHFLKSTSFVVEGPVQC